MTAVMEAADNRQRGGVRRVGRSIRDRLYPPPFIFGWTVPGPNSSAGRVHRLCNRALWPRGDVIGAITNAALIVLWPFVASGRALEAIRKDGETVRRLTGKSKPRQFIEQLGLAVGCRISPRHYYFYEFFRPDRRRLAPHYLMRYETKEIAFRLLYPVATEQSTPTPLKHKVEFARHCRINGLPHIPVLMMFEDGGRVSGADFVDRLPATDLFVKRVLGKGGAGSECWRHQGHGRYRSTRGDERDEAALMAHVSDLSRKEPFLIQPAVRNCPELRGLGACALCTTRLLSCRNEAGDFEITNAVFRMSVDPASPVDNFHSGGIAAAIDIATGELDPATDFASGAESKWYDRHPFTGAEIAGRRLPMWRETVDLAVRAHRVFRDYALVGWDVAVLEGGLCLIEGNRGPDMDLMQRPARGPLGSGRFGELLAHNLERHLNAR